MDFFLFFVYTFFVLFKIDLAHKYEGVHVNEHDTFVNCIK